MIGIFARPVVAVAPIRTTIPSSARWRRPPPLLPPIASSSLSSFGGGADAIVVARRRHHRRLPPRAAAAAALRGFSSCPFRELGLKNDGTMRYERVRTAFREMALRYHPDTRRRSPTNGDGRSGHDGSGGSSSSSSSSTGDFARIREAFEAIAEGPDGVAVLRVNYDGDYSRPFGNDGGDNNEMEVPDPAVGNNNSSSSYLDNSFQDERNGFLHPSVDPRVLREVAEVSKRMNPGGLDRGGMWQYANMIRNMAEDEDRGLPPLRVGGGDGDDDANNSKRGGTTSSRRRRRRR